MKRKPINKISAKKREEMIQEIEVRALLCARAGGVLDIGGLINGVPVSTCRGGRCETCGKKADWRGLSVHHKVFRSHQGKTDMDNCEMVCAPCHSRLHNICEKDG